MKKKWTLLAVSLFTCCALTASAAGEARTVTVTGEGHAVAAADTAAFTVSIETSSDSQQAAASENAVRTRAVRTALIAAGAQFDQLETGNYSVNPIYHYDQKGRRTLEGYTAINRIQVKISQLSKTGAVIDAAAGSGADRIDSIQFYNQNKLPYKNKALRSAAEDAREKAQAAASALGLTLGPVLSASESGPAAPIQTRLFAMSKMANTESAPTPIEGGEETIQVRLNVTFALQ